MQIKIMLNITIGVYTLFHIVITNSCKLRNCFSNISYRFEIIIPFIFYVAIINNITAMKYKRRIRYRFKCLFVSGFCSNKTFGSSLIFTPYGTLCITYGYKAELFLITACRFKGIDFTPLIFFIRAILNTDFILIFGIRRKSCYIGFKIFLFCINGFFLAYCIGSIPSICTLNPIFHLHIVFSNEACKCSPSKSSCGCGIRKACYKVVYICLKSLVNRLG